MTMIEMLYKAKIIKETDGSYFVSFPDCPGCTTYGSTKAEAINMAHEALSGWLEATLHADLIPPKPIVDISTADIVISDDLALRITRANEA